MTRSVRLTGLVAVSLLLLAACSPEALLEGFGREEPESTAEEASEPPESTSAAEDLEVPTLDEDPLGEDTDGDAAGTLPTTVEELGSSSLVPGRYSLQTEGARVELPEDYEVPTGERDALHVDDPREVIGVLERAPLLASDPAQYDNQLAALRDLAPGAVIALDTPVEVAGAEQAHLVLADDGSQAVAYLLARSTLGAALIGYSAPVERFDTEVVAYLLDALELGWEWLPPAPEDGVDLTYPAADGRSVEVTFAAPSGGWRIQDSYEQSLVRFVDEELQEIEFRLVADTAEDPHALVDDFEMWLPDAEIEREEVDVPGADAAVLARTDASGTEEGFVQHALMVAVDAGYTFQFSYINGHGELDAEVAESALATFEVRVDG